MSEKFIVREKYVEKIKALTGQSYGFL